MSNTATKELAPAKAVVPANPTVVVGKLIADYTSKGSLYLPEDYSPENALKSAWLALQAFDLKQFDQGSLVNSLLDMVVQGLNPQKKQCYFIPYGKSMTCQRSYFGDQALAVRVKPGIEIVAQVVYEGDTFEYSVMKGRKTVSTHSQKLANVNTSKIVAAYCEVYDSNGESLGAEIMTWEQIQKSWAKSKTYKPNGNGPHNEHPDQMALRTVIRRRCKPIINAANDALLMEAVRREEIAQGEAEIAEEAELYANQTPLSLPEQAVTVQVVEGGQEPIKAEEPPAQQALKPQEEDEF